MALIHFINLIYKKLGALKCQVKPKFIFITFSYVTNF